MIGRNAKTKTTLVLFYSLFLVQTSCKKQFVLTSFLKTHSLELIGRSLGNILICLIYLCHRLSFLNKNNSRILFHIVIKHRIGYCDVLETIGLFIRQSIFREFALFAVIIF